MIIFVQFLNRTNWRMSFITMTFESFFKQYFFTRIILSSSSWSRIYFTIFFKYRQCSGSKIHESNTRGFLNDIFSMIMRPIDVDFLNNTFSKYIGIKILKRWSFELYFSMAKRPTHVDFLNKIFSKDIGIEVLKRWSFEFYFSMTNHLVGISNIFFVEYFRC